MPVQQAGAAAFSRTPVPITPAPSTMATAALATQAPRFQEKLPPDPVDPHMHQHPHGATKTIPLTDKTALPAGSAPRFTMVHRAESGEESSDSGEESGEEESGEESDSEGSGSDSDVGSDEGSDEDSEESGGEEESEESGGDEESEEASAASKPAPKKQATGGAARLIPFGESSSKEAPKPLHRCIPVAGNPNKCRVDLPAYENSEWKVVTVARPDCGKDKEKCQQQQQQQQRGENGEESHPQLSPNPEIAAAQRAFFKKHAEVEKEKQWIEQVRGIVATYNRKISNVQRNVRQQSTNLKTDRARIIKMIQQEKEKKLEAELRAALDSLRHLESTSSVLTNKITELSATKLSLKNTITKIQGALNANLPKSVLDRTNGDNQNQVTVAQPRFQAMQAANTDAKSLFSKLMSLVETKATAHATTAATASTFAQQSADVVPPVRSPALTEEEEKLHFPPSVMRIVKHNLKHTDDLPPSLAVPKAKEGDELTLTGIQAKYNLA